MKVGIVGFGKMGRNIFSLFSDTPMDIVVLGRNQEEMDRQSGRLEKRLRRAVSSGMLAAEELPRRVATQRFTTSWAELRDRDLVIETVVEDLPTKIDVLRRIEATVAPRAVLTSNTSNLSITRLADCLRDAARFCGFHFFHPVQLTTVAEIITGPRTSPQVVELLRQVSRDIGRTPLVVKDRAGSCINVPLTCHTCEALYVLEQGLASPSRIDAIAGRFARLGPCEALDTIGIPFFTGVLGQTIEAFSLAMVVPDLLHTLTRDGRVGKYANQGLYLYRDDRPTDGASEYYLNAAQGHTPAGARSDDTGLYERLLFPIYFSVLKLAQMGLGSIEDLSLGITDMVGLKLDPVEEMRKLGSRGLREVFDRLRAELGPRFDCAPLERIMATVDKR